MSSSIDPAATLGALVAERPERGFLFERLRLDYCCGGGQTLQDACDRRTLDLATVCAALEAVEATASERPSIEDADWRQVSVEQLCAHIVTEHHNRTRTELPRIRDLLATVARVHGTAHPEMRELQLVFDTVCADLAPHLEREEAVLFPACIARERGGPPVDVELLAEHEHEHAHVGEGLARMRELSGGDYAPRCALCATHRALLAALDGLEHDLHQHIHEENNVLLPRVRELNASASRVAD